MRDVRLQWRRSKTNNSTTWGSVMKQWTICAMLCASTSYAHAEDLLQIYGIVDGGVAYATNIAGAHSWFQTSGVAQSDRWGLRGSEELGGGNRAIFRLENGFTLNDGRFSQGGLEFGRQAFVGIASDRFGTLTLGRQYDFMTTNLTVFSSGTLTPSVFAFHLGDLDRLGAERIDNAVRYVTPEFAGFQLGALYALGGQPGNFSSHSAAAFGASYVMGAFRAGAAYTEIHDYTAVFGIGTTVLGAPLVGTSSQGLLRRFQTFDKLTGSGIGASYQLGPALVHALYTMVDLRQNGASATLRTAEGGVRYSINYALSLAGSYAHSTLAGKGWNQFVGGADYLLSKRTDIYLNAVYLHASSGVQAELFGVPASSSNSQTVVTLGMRHAF
ncbi:porin [Trinickia symbiotica]|uniref:Porin n=2 Tax=Trinickia symbiotica TaxID=863227 RepID=A0A2T3Y180_9BURK|nr:porin [Trinickia symbiotica]